MLQRPPTVVQLLLTLPRLNVTCPLASRPEASFTSTSTRASAASAIAAGTQVTIAAAMSAVVAIPIRRG
jgi:hypothetical protein